MLNISGLSISELDLTNNNILDDGLSALAFALESESSQLRLLVLSAAGGNSSLLTRAAKNGITAVGMRRLGQALAQNANLKRIVLDENVVGEGALEVLQVGVVSARRATHVVAEHERRRRQPEVVGHHHRDGGADRTWSVVSDRQQAKALAEGAAKNPECHLVHLDLRSNVKVRAVHLASPHGGRWGKQWALRGPKD